MLIGKGFYLRPNGIVLGDRYGSVGNVDQNRQVQKSYCSRQTSDPSSKRESTGPRAGHPHPLYDVSPTSANLEQCAHIIFDEKSGVVG